MTRNPLRAKAVDPVVDTRAAAALLGVSDGTIRSWASRGQLQRRGINERRRTVYSVDDLYAMKPRAAQGEPDDATHTP